MGHRWRFWSVLAGLLGLIAVAGPGAAQDAAGAPSQQTLAEIRAEIDALAGEIAGLRGELIAPDPVATGIVNPGPLRARVDETAQDVQRLQAAIEALTLRVEQVVADGTNRVGDLEFRLHELANGDFADYQDPAPLGEGPGAQDTSALAALRPKLRNGGPVTGVLPTVTPAPGTDPFAQNPAPATDPFGQPAIADPFAQSPADAGQAPQPNPQSEQQVFDIALGLFQAGDFAGAEREFGAFLERYPGSPLAGDAAYWRGGALAGLGDWNAAARSYLDSFSGAPQGPKAAEALLRLGQSLGRLGQTNEACLTLAEVPLRYPNSATEVTQQAAAERQALSCS